MDNVYDTMTIEELVLLRRTCLRRASAFKNSKDGSYEQCLHNSSYYETTEELERRGIDYENWTGN